MSDSSPIAILPHTDKSWHQSGSQLLFGRMYHSWFPSTWTHQILGAPNINFAVAAQFYCGLHATYSFWQSPSKCCRAMSSCHKVILSWWLIVYKSTSITILLILLTLVVVSQFGQWCLDFGSIVASGLPGRASQWTVTVAGQCCPHWLVPSPLLHTALTTGSMRAQLTE